MSVICGATFGVGEAVTVGANKDLAKELSLVRADACARAACEGALKVRRDTVDSKESVVGCNE